MATVTRPASDGIIEEPADLAIGLAADTDAFDAAFRLVHDQYTWRGYMASTSSGRRLSLHHVLPSTKVFVARQHDRVIGTLTLVQDSLFGLPLDELYREEVAGLRADQRRLSEVTALATAAESRRAGVTVLLHLMRAMVTYAMHVGGTHDLCITVNPRHVEFYRKCLRFAAIGPERSYDKVNGAPAVLLRLNLEIACAVEASVHRGEDREPIHTFLFARAHQERILAQLRSNLASAHFRRAQFVEFFGDGVLLQRLSPEMRARVEAFFAPVSVERPCEVAAGAVAWQHRRLDPAPALLSA